MKEKITSYLYGAVRVEIAGENKERFVNLCRSSGIYIWDIRNDRNYNLCVSVEDFFRLKPIVRKTAVKLRITEKYGIPFLIYRYRKRKMFLAGIITSFILVYVLSLFIWDVQVEGNFSYSDYEIIKFLKENNISQGIKKKELDCDQIEKDIRNHYFDITWVSVEVSGTRLIVHMKENEEELQGKEESSSSQGNEQTGEEGYDLAAVRDAIVTGIVMRSGTPAVKAGMEVKTGDILVYGHYDIVDDSKEVVRTQYLTADADIYGQVVYPYEYDLPLKYIKKEYDSKSKTRFFLRIGDKILKTTDNKEGNEELITDEKQVSLYGNFYLPAYILKNTYKTYTEKEYVYSEEQAKSICEEKLSYFIEKLEKNTIQIVENNVTIEVNGDVCHSEGTVTVIENIGQLKPAAVKDLTGEATESYE